MIPILFDANETEFATNGLGRLSDAVDCTVTEERNGQYELEMQYPVTGIHYTALLEERIVFAVPSEGTLEQPFRIYRITKPIDGIVTVYAQHISYMLKKMVVMPFTASSPSAAMAAVESNIVGENPFSFWTDKTTAGSMSLQVPAECRSILGGTEGSVLDSFGGGEYEFDRFAVKLRENRGEDNGVTIRYGKNLTGLEADANYENTYTAVVPYWQGQGESGASITVIGDKVESEHTGDYSYQKCVTMDFSQDFQTQPTKQQLANAARAYMKNNSVWAPTVSTDVEYQPLWQSEEYADIATLERVRLCDIVTVEDMRLGVSVKAKVIETVYDVLQDRYRSVQLGDARATIAETVARKSDVDAAIKKSETWLEQAVRDASALISGGLGGHVVIRTNADGKPEEILIMDTDDIKTAQKVWRWNMGGLGYSSTGYSGTYETAITMDGKIAANFVLAGTMLANRIKGGTLTLGGKENGQGVLVILDEEGNEIGRWGNEGVVLKSGSIEGPSITLGGVDNVGRLSIRDSKGKEIGYIDNTGAHLNSGSISIGNSFSVSSDGSVIANSLKSSNVDISGGSIRLKSQEGSVINITSGDGNLSTTIGGQGIEVADTYHGVTTHLTGNMLFFSDGMAIGTRLMQSGITTGSLTISGSKSRVVNTKNYQNRLLYCYEMPSPMFGDIGGAVTDENGECYIYLDDIFSETVSAQIEYQVFLQKEGEGDVWIAEKTPQYFVVKGTENLKFAWEIKAKQRDYEYERLEAYSEELDNSEVDYEKQYIEEIEKLIRAEEEILNETA